MFTLAEILQQISTAWEQGKIDASQATSLYVQLDEIWDEHGSLALSQQRVLYWVRTLKGMHLATDFPARVIGAVSTLSEMLEGGKQ